MKNNFLKICGITVLSALLMCSCTNNEKENTTEKSPVSEETKTPEIQDIPKTTELPLVESITVTDETPGDYYGIYAMSDGIFKVASHNLSVGLMRADGELIMPCLYSTCRTICDNVTAVRDDMGLWSYFNVETGKFIVEKQDSMFNFSEGIGCYFDGELYRYVNPDGTTAIEGTFYEAAPFSDGLSRVLTKDSFGYMDKSGKIVLHSDYLDFDDFCEGMARVHENGKFGYIGKDGNLKFIMDTDAIFNYKDGLAAFITGKNIGYIDKDGRVSAEPKYQRPKQETDEYYRFECGVAPVIKDGKYGFINKDGELVIDAIYDNAMYAVNGIIRVQNNKLFGYVKTDGTVITDCIFTEAGTFTKDGIAKVLKDGKYYFINKEGKELTAERFDDASDFCGNTAFVVKEGTETWYKVTVNQ